MHLSIISSESIAGFTDTKVVAKGVTGGRNVFDGNTYDSMAGTIFQT